MKRITIILLCILLCAYSVGCAANTSNSNSKPTESAVISNQPETNSANTETTSTTLAETTDTTIQPTPNATDQVPTSEKEASSTTPAKENSSDVSKETNPPKTPDKPKEDTKPTSPAPTESNKPKPTKPQETKPPKEDPKPTETPKPTEKPKPTDPYAYPFNINQIRQDCISQGKGYGFKLNESLTPNNASWAGAETADADTDGAYLKRSLREMIEYYSPTYRENVGLPEANISAFNIYCEPLGNNTYRIYFLFLI